MMKIKQQIAFLSAAWLVLCAGLTPLAVSYDNQAVNAALDTYVIPPTDTAPEAGVATPLQQLPVMPVVDVMPLPVVAAQPAEPAQAQVWALPQDNGGEKIDVLELKDMDINDVLKLLSARLKLNIIAGKNVQGRVTMFLRDVPVRDALMIILRSNDLAYIEHNGLLEIMPSLEYEQKTGAKFGLKTATEVFSVQYSKAEDIVNNIRAMVTPGVGSVQSDIKSNKIILTDTLPRLERIRAVILSLDHPGLETDTEVFAISYAKAEDIMKAVAAILTRDVGHIEFDAVSNKVLVTDTQAILKVVRRVVGLLDRKDKEVLIEARIVQIVLSDAFKMGIDWEGILSYKNKDRASFINDFTLGDGVVPRSITTVGTLSADNYQFVLDMIETMGETRLLSSPRIAVTNNQLAKIHIGSTEPYVTTSQLTNATGPTTTAETVNFIDVGVKLSVTPMIHDDGYITMKILPEISSRVGKVTTSQKNDIPVVASSQVDTTVRVKDGVTIIIGGLIKNEAVNDQGKIPLLGDIPLVGRAFRNDSRSVVKTEIVIFLTPHIITGDLSEDPARYPTVKRDKLN